MPSRAFIEITEFNFMFQLFEINLINNLNFSSRT